MKVSDLGEFGLIRELEALARHAKPRQTASAPRLEIGIGDDAAAWRFGRVTEVCTTDTMVAGVHFIPGKIPWRDLGWKSMASNLSDVAAMGCVPHYALVTLGLPPDTETEDMLEVYRGMLECCQEYGGQIVGGDLVGSPTLFITVALTGTTSGELLRRSGAKPGDSIAVSGPLGASAGGLRLLTEQSSASERLAQPLLTAHHRPQPRVAEGQRLAELGVRAAMDISDGLLDDLAKLCQASGVAAHLDQESVPIDPAAREAFPKEALALALNGGEDYELLFTAPPNVMERVAVELATPPTVIGQIVRGEAGTVTLLDAQGRPSRAPSRGWDHFQLGGPGATVTNSPEETQELGRALGELAAAGDVFLLGGGLGVGKTCLTQGIAWGLGVREHARSPTFVLVTEHQGRLPLYHADLYRLDHVEEVLDLGLDEYLEGPGVLVVEWAEKAPAAFPVDHLWVTLTALDETTRRIVLEPRGQRYDRLVAKLETAWKQQV